MSSSITSRAKKRTGAQRRHPEKIAGHDGGGGDSGGIGGGGGSGAGSGAGDHRRGLDGLGVSCIA